MSFFNNDDLIFRQTLGILSFYQSYKICLQYSLFSSLSLELHLQIWLGQTVTIPNLFLSSRLPGIVCLDASSSSSHEPDLKLYNPQSSSNMFSIVFGWFLSKKNQSKKLKL